ncbi:hypothetical protein WN093_14645 [Gammaproteobacteria bacterium AS21]
MNLKAPHMLVVFFMCLLSKQRSHKKHGIAIFSCVVSVLMLSACTVNNKKIVAINAQQLISEQDVIDIATLATEQLELLLNIKLQQRPTIHFVSAQQLKAHILEHAYIVDLDNAQALSHYSQSVVAVYCEYEKDIYVVEDNIQVYERVDYSAQELVYEALLHILTHELVHAIQDQQGLLNWYSDDDAENSAFSTLVEGHADLQTALVLERMGVIDDIYNYGVQTVASDSDDIAFNQYSDKFSQKYVTGKKIFNEIHQKYGNGQAWRVLKRPELQIQRMLNR